MEKRIQKTCVEVYWEAAKRAVLNRTLTVSAPVYRNKLNAVEDMLDDPYHAELNAHYCLDRGQVLAERYVLPVFDWDKYRTLREEDVQKAYAMWAEHEEKKREFFLSVAEELWDFKAFTARYSELLDEEEIERYHAYCRKIFIEERVFLQPEWLLFSSAQWQGKMQFLYQNPRVEFFCQAHTDALKLLPISVLQSKAFKKMLAKKHKLKKAA